MRTHGVEAIRAAHERWRKRHAWAEYVARFVANVPTRLGGDLAPTTVRERETVETLQAEEG